MNKIEAMSRAQYRGRPRAISMSRLMYIVPVLVLALRLASPATANISYLVLAVYALTGRSQAIQALFMSWFISMLSPGLAPEMSFSAIGRYAVMAGAMVSVLVRFRPRNGRLGVNRLVLSTVLLGVFLIGHSALVSTYPDVSLLKSISFIVVFITLLSAWSGLNRVTRIQTERFVFGGMILILLASLPLIVTGVGYLRNNTGFQGVLGHPQAFGPFVALLAAWLGGRFLSEKAMPAWQIAIFALCPFLILASEARTAGGAVALGLTLPLMFVLLFSGYKVKTILPGMFTKRFVVGFWVGLIGIIAFSTLFFSQLDNYILKSGRSTGTDLRSALQASRGEPVENMMHNIKKKPLEGIGFGIASFPESMIIIRDPYFGLPVSASIEKGVLPVAIVEELGIPGGLFVFGWFALLFRRASYAGFTALAVITTAVMTNLGESTFFSAGGMGMLIMIMVTWAAIPARPTAP